MPFSIKFSSDFPADFLNLLDRQTPRQMDNYRFESVEVKELSFRIDKVFLPPEDAKSKVLFFAEVQFQKHQSL
jgi:predicted transposase YdaD